jgi:hypothetical protein
MGLTAQQVIAARAPQYATDSRLATFIILAQQRTSTTRFGENYGLAVALRVLHMMDLEASRGGGSTNSGISRPGALASKSEGEISESYFGAMQKRYGDKFPDLCQTAYGIELIELIEGSILCPMTRIDSTNFPDV